MRTPTISNSTNLCLTPLAACLAAILVIATPDVFAATHVVTNCNETGAGSLRAVIGASTTNSGDIIDMTALTCSLITVKTGTLVVAQDDLTLNGPGQDALFISKYDTTTNHRIFRHTGHGTLALNDLTVSGGYAGPDSTPPGQGGCIFSFGSVGLDHVSVLDCKATGQSYITGGGVWVANSFSASHSTISGNIALASAGDFAKGGGIMVYGSGSTVLAETTVANNSALGDPSRTSGGGLVIRAGNLTMNASTISGNHSDGMVGGLAMLNYAGGGTAATISNSTISGNTADTYIGGIFSKTSVTVQNSTIAFNTAGSGTYLNDVLAAGLSITAQNGGFAVAVNLQSTLIANNTYGTFDEDSDFNALGAPPTALTISGSNNLIRNAHGGAPVGTISACPLLGPLRDNGGETLTHALLSHSPGIDQGNNAAGFNLDQRHGANIRVYGSAADIGAYEVQNDIIFNTSFEGCPIIPN